MWGAIKAVSGWAKTINPVFTLALTAYTLYTMHKQGKEMEAERARIAAATPTEEEIAAQKAKLEKEAIAKEKESYNRRLEYSEEARIKAEANNRHQRSYNHLGFSFQQGN
jgi:hypothetical protein